MKKLITTGLTIGVVASLVACEGRRVTPEQGATPEQYGTQPERAAAPDPGPNPVIPARTEKVDLKAEVDDFQTAPNIELDGSAELLDRGEGVKIVVELESAPVGTKAVHIHEKGDCSDVRGQSMGGHFAPEKNPHGLPTAAASERHLGDLGNIEIAKNGKGRLEISVPGANLRPGDKLSFVGKALVIHEGEDKGASAQPSGGAGKPMACGVIEEE